MNHLPEITVGVLAVVMAVLHVSGRSKKLGLPVTGWPFILAGSGLLLIGGVLEHPGTLQALGPAGLGLNNAALELLKALVGFGLGYVCMAIGLVRWLMALFGLGKNRKKKTSDAAMVMGNDIHASQELLDSILKSSANGIMVFRALRDDGGNLIDLECRLLNKAGEQLLGRSAGDVLGKPLIQQLPCLRNEHLLDEVESVLRTGLPYEDERFFQQGGRGNWFHIFADKHADGVAVTVVDITSRKKSERELRHTAEHDALTGLANRALFLTRLKTAMHRAKRFHDYKFAVLFLDFDRFKIINDSLGHKAGDELLVNIANRLRSNLRELDAASRYGGENLPARLGGDEFVVMLDGIQSTEDAIAVAERLQRELSMPHQICDEQVISTASIGIVVGHSGYENPEDIVRDADTAMYRAKTTGKARHVVFDQHMHEEVVARLALERELREAVENKVLDLRYEPIVSLADGRLVGFETLIRWPHPERGMLEPADFIGIAEEVGIIVPMGEWIMQEASARFAGWERPADSHSPLVLSINLSRRQLTHPGLVAMIDQALEQSGLPPETLWLEITESVVMNDVEGLAPVLKELKSRGVMLAMDDFGTGHSSLSCLHRLPFDIVKIDRSFISGEGRKHDYAAIVHAIIELASNLNMKVVAEGIEAVDQIAMLQNLRCQCAQGHLFSPPLDSEAAQQLIQDGLTWNRAA